jgi:ATPase subunit of ABC transporter with duplicated ATPase domains
VNKCVSVLSGEERARLALAKIALQTPKLLLIDEITNNIDLETKEHIPQVLKEYPGAMIIISHDSAFLEEISITHNYTLPADRHTYIDNQY